MATCSDNSTVGITGCGASYGGELQHSVARCSWSTHPDGRAHITGTVNQIDYLWKGDRIRHPDETTGAKALHLVDGRLRGLAPDGPHPWATLPGVVAPGSPPEGNQGTLTPTSAPPVAPAATETAMRGR